MIFERFFKKDRRSASDQTILDDPRQSLRNSIARNEMVVSNVVPVPDHRLKPLFKCQNNHGLRERVFHDEVIDISEARKNNFRAAPPRCVVESKLIRTSLERDDELQLITPPPPRRPAAAHHRTKRLLGMSQQPDTRPWVDECSDFGAVFTGPQPFFMEERKNVVSVSQVVVESSQQQPAKSNKLWAFIKRKLFSKKDHRKLSTKAGRKAAAEKPPLLEIPQLSPQPSLEVVSSQVVDEPPKVLQKQQPWMGFFLEEGIIYEHVYYSDDTEETADETGADDSDSDAMSAASMDYSDVAMSEASDMASLDYSDAALSEASDMASLDDSDAALSEASDMASLDISDTLSEASDMASVDIFDALSEASDIVFEDESSVESSIVGPLESSVEEDSCVYCPSDGSWCR